LLPASADSIQALAQKIDQALLAKMKDEHIPGVAVVIVQNGKIIYKKGYGLANTDTKQKVSVDSTIFRIGSTSKALTFLTLTKLIEKGLVNYEDAISKYVAGIENPYHLKDTIRIKHLLTHTGGFDQIGFGRQILDFELTLEERKAKRPSILAFLQGGNMRRIRPAGQHFTYDTYGTTVAGAIIAKVTGLSYKEAMQQELFQVLGMHSTSVEVEPDNLGRLAKGHGYVNGQYKTMPYEIYLTPPASSIDASPLDMGRLLEALTNQGSNAQGRLFRPETLKRVIAPQFRPHPEFVGMSHGLWESQRIGAIPDAYSIRTIGHGGDMLGITCAMDLIPDLDLGFFVVANRNGEAGGGGVSIGRPVMNIILEHFGIEKKTPPYQIPKANTNLKLEEYAGNYTFSIYCHTCSEEEIQQGAWSRGNLIPIRVNKNTLLLDGEVYLAREKDIFIREDGQEMIFFGRNKDNRVAFFVFSDNSHSFEKVEN
ncbi:MAG: serine hydrolase domain-containing protein, partial [Bacteroidota bacterium]